MNLWRSDAVKKDDRKSAVLQTPIESALTSWYDRPLSDWWCVFCWLVATLPILVPTRLFGALSTDDAFESVFSTWAVAHGHLSCTFPPGTPPGDPGIAPLYPLFSGGIAALFRIGHRVAFPSLAALGPHCESAVAVMDHWSIQSGALLPTLRIGYLTWLVLIAGLVAFLRASGLGRTRWEPAALLLAVSAPPTFMALSEDFHPQDLLAMGLVLAALACSLRDRWAWAGGLLGLAVTSQQFALLVLGPLIVVAPQYRRVRCVATAIGTGALIVLPMLAFTSGRALRAIIIGSGNTPSIGGTVLWEFHIHGPLLVGLSRVLPIMLSVALAWWALRRLGPAVLEPVPLTALVTASLSLRLLLEDNLFAYYFMPLTVFLIVLTAIRHRIDWWLPAWLFLTVLAFSKLPSVGSLAIQSIPSWFWQVVLLTFVVPLAVKPLVQFDQEGPH